MRSSHPHPRRGLTNLNSIMTKILEKSQPTPLNEIKYNWVSNNQIYIEIYFFIKT